MFKKKTILQLLFFIIILGILATYFCDKIIVKNAEHKSYSSIEKIPYSRVARVKVFLDYIFGKKPKFLGKKVPIPA